MKKKVDKNPDVEIIDISSEQCETCETCKQSTHTGPKNKSDRDKDIKLLPYREIELSDGHGFYIKTTCNLTSDERVQVIQYRESPDPEGAKFSCSDPVYFETRAEFLEWLSQLIIHNFDKIPYIKIVPLKEEDIKRKERETTETMYL